MNNAILSRILKGRINSKEQARFRAIQQLNSEESSINPFKDNIIFYLNYLTDSNDTIYDGFTPANSEIEYYADIINGEII